MASFRPGEAFCVALNGWGGVHRGDEWASPDVRPGCRRLRGDDLPHRRRRIVRRAARGWLCRQPGRLARDAHGGPRPVRQLPHVARGAAFALSAAASADTRPLTSYDGCMQSRFDPPSYPEVPRPEPERHPIVPTPGTEPPRPLEVPVPTPDPTPPVPGPEVEPVRPPDVEPPKRPMPPGFPNPDPAVPKPPATPATPDAPPTPSEPQRVPEPQSPPEVPHREPPSTPPPGKETNRD